MSKQTEAKKPEAGDFPPWIQKILRQQVAHNKRYEKARALVAEAYNDFLSAISDVNNEHGTTFTIDQALAEWSGDYAPEAEEVVDDDDES
jgi:hypothetical protein